MQDLKSRRISPTAPPGACTEPSRCCILEASGIDPDKDSSARSSLSPNRERDQGKKIDAFFLVGLGGPPPLHRLCGHSGYEYQSPHHATRSRPCPEVRPRSTSKASSREGPIPAGPRTPRADVWKSSSVHENMDAKLVVRDHHDGPCERRPTWSPSTRMRRTSSSRTSTRAALPFHPSRRRESLHRKGLKPK